MMGEAELARLEATTATVVETPGAAGADVTTGAAVGAVGGAPPTVAGKGAVAGGSDGSAVKSGYDPPSGYTFNPGMV
jgi:hypothetical protein